MREEIEWEPERLGDHHRSIINASPTLRERGTQGGLGITLQAHLRPQCCLGV